MPADNAVITVKYEITTSNPDKEKPCHLNKVLGRNKLSFLRGCRTKKLVRCPFFYVNVVYNLKNKSQASKTLGFMVKY